MNTMSTTTNDLENRKAIRYKIDDGVVVDQSLFKVLATARRIGTHGEVAFVHACSTGVTAFCHDGGHIRGEVRVYNAVLKDVQEEPERREAYRASHPRTRGMAKVQDQAGGIAVGTETKALLQAWRASTPARASVHASGMDERMARHDHRAADPDAAHHRKAVIRW